MLDSSSGSKEKIKQISSRTLLLLAVFLVVLVGATIFYQRGLQIGQANIEDILPSPIPITRDLNNQINPKISGDKITWQDNRYGTWDIYMYDLDNNQERRI